MVDEEIRHEGERGKKSSVKRGSNRGKKRASQAACRRESALSFIKRKSCTNDPEIKKGGKKERRRMQMQK